ncbi:hypothetical protein MBLNU230_g6859t1 [Neophaeotheca triangularis]
MGKPIVEASGHGLVELSDLSNSRPVLPLRKQNKISTWTRLKKKLRKDIHDSWRKYALEGLLREKPLPPSKDGRHIPLEAVHEHKLLDERRGHGYISNAVRSSRYTVWNFLPKQLYFQFTRLANFYFLCIGIPQTLPGVSTTGSYTTILPLLFFVLLTIAKEGYDDFRRHRLDEVENTSLATVVRAKQYTRPVEALKKIPVLRHVRFPAFLKKAEAAESEERIDEGDDSEDTRWTRVQWREIGVGDVIRLKRDDPVPADVVLLYASGEDGVAYVETMALDGETNLKSRQAHSAFHSCRTIAGIQSLAVTFVSEDPNANLYDYNGRATLGEQRVPLSLNEVLLRGCVLRNTDLAIGLVINTGEECKIRQNANHHPTAKKPMLERYANQVVLTLIVYVVLLSAGLSVGYRMWQVKTEQKSWYLNGPGYSAEVDFGKLFIGFAIMFNNVIPLALYVSLEIVKIGQMLMLNGDIEMFDEASNTPMRCNTNTILENLGQVRYVFSDKTGTLTENVMRFRKMTVGGMAWSHTLDEQTVDVASRKDGIVVTERPVSSKAMASVSRHSGESQRSPADRTTAQLVDYIQTQPSSQFAKQARDFLLGVAICHACLPETRADGSVDFQGSSPDEVALVRAASELGYVVCHRSSQFITLLLRGPKGAESKETYEILDTIEFSSKRKRMSIIVKRPDGRLWLICKGADTTILPLLENAALAEQKANEVQRNVDSEHAERVSAQMERPRNSFGGSSNVPPRISIDHARSTKSMEIARVDGHEKFLRPSVEIRPVSFDVPRSSKGGLLQPHYARMALNALVDEDAVRDEAVMFKQSFQQLHDFATEGLRTLLFAQKELSPAVYSAWKKLYTEATTALIDRQARTEAAGDMVECGLRYLGATAIEDKLQAGVPETIGKLRRANIRIWMLTGDKRETAINIAHSAKICKPESEIVVLDSVKGGLLDQYSEAAVKVAASVHSVLVIDGRTLALASGTPELEDAFYSLIPSVDSVICCRASPAQKADIVTAIRDRTSQELTLAIGDGANDLAMIQASHVGIGISGREGLQAARVADYSIAQFRFLQRLLLVHGRWNYSRTAGFILKTFWKEFFFYMMQACYQRHVGYTGTSLYEQWSLTVLNTLFTSLCTIVPGIFERDLSTTTLLAVPELYIYGQRNLGLNLPKYLAWIAGATAEGLCVWYVSWRLFGLYSLAGDNNIFALGDLSFSLGIVWTNFKLLLLDAHDKTAIVFGSFLITVGGWWAWNGFMASVYAPSQAYYMVRDGFNHTFGTDPAWWLTLTVVFGMLFAVEVFYKALKRAIVMQGWWDRLRWLVPKRWRGPDRAAEWKLERWQILEKDPVVWGRLVEMVEGVHAGDRIDEFDESVTDGLGGVGVTSLGQVKKAA